LPKRSVKRCAMTLIGWVASASRYEIDAIATDCSSTMTSICGWRKAAIIPSMSPCALLTP
jgi:hypothetical protein